MTDTPDPTATTGPPPDAVTHASAVRRVPERIRSRLARQRGRPLDLVPWGVLAVLLAVLLWRLPGIGDAIRSNADTSSPFTIAHTLRDEPDAAAFLGNYGWWNGLWVVQVLIRLPKEVAVVTYLPIAVTLVAIGAMTVQARRLFGARAAVVVPLVAASVAYPTWGLDGAWSGRAASWWAMIGLGLVLVAHAGGAFSRRPRAMALATVIAIVWCAAALSGDSLAWTSVALPGAGVGVFALLARRWRPAVFPLVVSGAIVLLSLAIRSWAEDAGYFKHVDAVEPAEFRAARSGMGALAQALQDVWGTATTDLSSAAGYLGALLVLVAAASAVTALVGAITESERRRDLPAAAGAWTAFWLGVVLATCVGYAFSTGVSDPAGGPIPRYLYGLPFAAAALLAAFASRLRVRALVVGPVVLLAALTAAVMVDRRPELTPESRLGALPAISAVASRYGVTRGYSSYWSASPLTLRSGFGLNIQPVGQCNSPVDAVALCPTQVHYVDRAYVPRRGVRSFLITDTALGAAAGPGSPYPAKPPPGVRPIAKASVGAGLTMYVYDHDLAREIQPRTITGEPIAHHP